MHVWAQRLTRLECLVLQGLPPLRDAAVGGYVVDSLAPLPALESLELLTSGSGTGNGLAVPNLRRLLSAEHRAVHPFLARVHLDPCAATPATAWQRLAQQTHPLIRVGVQGMGVQFCGAVQQLTPVDVCAGALG